MKGEDSAPVGWLSPKLRVVKQPDKGGQSVVAAEAIAAHEVVAVWGGDIVTGERLRELDPIAQRYSVQVEENLYLVTPRTPDPADLINHSCNPNLGMSGQIVLVALREIAPGEEVTIDYAMVDGTPYDEFDCECGAPNCRKRVTGNDWSDPSLWEQYEGYFSPYLQRRIDRLKAARTNQATGGT